MQCRGRILFMSGFIQDKWKIYDNHYWTVRTTKEELIADCVNEANARLIAIAPEMYELLKEELIPTSDYGGILSFERERKVRELLARIENRCLE